MDYGLTEIQEEIRELAAQIAREKVLPVRAELDESEEFPYEAMQALADSDMCGIYIPEEYGGMGLGVMDLALAMFLQCVWPSKS